MAITTGGKPYTRVTFIDPETGDPYVGGLPVSSVPASASAFNGIIGYSRAATGDMTNNVTRGNYPAVAFQVTAMATGGAIQVQETLDNGTTWAAVPITSNAISGDVMKVTATGFYVANVNGVYIRFFQTDHTSGTTTVIPAFVGDVIPGRREAGAQGSVAIAADDAGAYAPGRLLGVNCTSAGNVKVSFVDGSTLTVPVAVGWSTFPFAVTRVWTTGTTATATYANLK